MSSSNSPDVACTCDVDSLRTQANAFVVAPTLGGGWTALTEAFIRLLVRLVSSPAHCVVIRQAVRSVLLDRAVSASPRTTRTSP